MTSRVEAEIDGVGANDQWGSSYHLTNETAPGTPAKTVYIQFTPTYERGANTTNSRPLVRDCVASCGPTDRTAEGNRFPLLAALPRVAPDPPRRVRVVVVSRPVRRTMRTASTTGWRTDRNCI
jgi:hypothetical protein